MIWIPIQYQNEINVVVLVIQCFFSEAYSESCQTSKMVRFAKIVNGF